MNQKMYRTKCIDLWNIEKIYLKYPLHYRVEHGVGGDVGAEPVPGQRRAQPGEVQQPGQRQRGGGGGLGAGQGHRAEPDVISVEIIVDNLCW